MEDVQHALSTALEEYEKKSNGSKVRKWLSSCSSRVTYYGSAFDVYHFHVRNWKAKLTFPTAVFDVFVQHHPEYVSLVWGTFKFLFIVRN
jgi:hypothetical protein